MLAHQSFEKRGKMVRAESDLGTGREVEKLDLVNSGRHPAIAASPLATAVKCQSEPAVKVVRDGGAKAPRIPFHTTAHRVYSSRKQDVQIASRIESGVAAVEFPFGSGPVLPCRESANAA